MKKRYTVLGLSLVLALALAVPAMGGPTNPLASASKSVQSIANQALKKAKAAQKTANAAQSTANSAASSASSASGAAGKAQSTADAAQKEAKAAQTSANTAKSAADSAKTTANTAFATAAAAKTAADTAQASANSAKAIAESKMSGEVQVESTEHGNLSIAACPAGKVPTGGGYIVNGTNSSSATVVESTQYANSWLVIADQINGVAGTTWEATATVNCATSP
jgi:membrane protein involved in colicin uptake